MKAYNPAISDYTRAISLCPQVGDYYTARALAYQAIGNIDSARRDLIIAAGLGEPQAQKIVSAWIAAERAKNAALYKG